MAELFLTRYNGAPHSVGMVALPLDDLFAGAAPDIPLTARYFMID